MNDKAHMDCRGCGKKGLATYLPKIMRDQYVDFVGLHETMKKDYIGKMANKIPWSACMWQ